MSQLPQQNTKPHRMSHFLQQSEQPPNIIAIVFAFVAAVVDI
jgi:hypothetical protein